MMRNPETVTTTSEQRLDVAARLVLILGLGVLIVLAGLAIGVGLAILQRDWRPIPSGLAVGLGAAGLAVLAMAAHDILQALEVATQRDINHDGRIGDEATPVLLRTNAAPPQDGAAFAAFVESCQHDTSLRRWEPVIGRAQYQAWRDVLLSAGWAKWRSSDQRSGWELTAPVETILQALS